MHPRIGKLIHLMVRLPEVHFGTDRCNALVRSALLILKSRVISRPKQNRFSKNRIATHIPHNASSNNVNVHFANRATKRGSVSRLFDHLMWHQQPVKSRKQPQAILRDTTSSSVFVTTSCAVHSRWMTDVIGWYLGIFDGRTTA